MEKIPLKTRENSETGKQIIYEDYADLFSHQIRQLGKDGLTNWLIESFCPNTPMAVAGHFEYEEEVPLPIFLRLVVDDFDQEVRNIFISSIKTAIDQFDPAIGSYGGLYALTALGDEFGMKEHLPKLAAVLQTWLNPANPEDQFAKAPHSQNDFKFLEETLECAYRLKHKNLAAGNEDADSLQPVEAWSYQILMNKGAERSLSPAWAPAFFLAISHSLQKNDGADIEQLIQTLKSGSWDPECLDKDLEPFFIFEDKTTGLKYPYNIEEILKYIDEFKSLQNSTKEDVASALE